jgi:rhodanese-related sulfurtransferase
LEEVESKDMCPERAQDVDAGGIPMEWIAKIFGSPTANVTPAQAQARLHEKDRPFLLDVRQPEEFREGHIQGAALIPLNELPARMKELPANREIICVCRSGNRSSSATRQLSSAGFRAANLQGGMIAWTRSGLPVKKGNK